jgi:hypothetical protein
VTVFVSQEFEGELFKLNGGLLMPAPAGTPAEILQRISRGVVEVADSPKAVALRDAFAIQDTPTTIQEAQRRWREESPVQTRLTDQLGIKID